MGRLRFLGKLFATGRDLVKSLPINGSVWGYFYPLICRDRGKPCLGTAAHKKVILNELLKDALGKKVQKMGVTRWFG